MFLAISKGFPWFSSCFPVVFGLFDGEKEPAGRREPVHVHQVLGGIAHVEQFTARSLSQAVEPPGP